jgi:hypothetical protein
MPLTVTRSLLVILIPGLVALAPWLLWLIEDFEKPETYYKDYPQLVWAGLFAVSVIAGSVLEGINSWIEVMWDDRKQRRGRDVKGDWYEYLSRVCPSEPVGHGYLSRMVTTMYFELAMCWALLSFGIGATVVFKLSCAKTALTILIAVLLAGWMFYSAKESHDVLCETRREINKRLGPVKPL